MSLPIIIDRRKNPGKKNLNNRQRFLDRFKKQIQEQARKHIGDRSISDGSDQEVTINGGTDEPRFNHQSDSGEWDHVLPGNKEYLPGDSIDKPRNGGAKGSKAGKGKGEDEFTFVLSYDEYLDIIFDDLELPDLIKASEKTIQSHQMRRAGFSTAGVPSNLNVERTAIAGLGRRIALRNPKIARIKELEIELETLRGATPQDDSITDRIAKIEEEIQRLRIQIHAVGYLDRVDLRYNNFLPQPKPITQAVMFCILDVSSSMGEREKIIAKKFFLLLYLFLRRRYKDINVVFIRHHEEAEECDEETFFTSRMSGGTVVSTAYQKVDEIIRDRYNADDWNIYIAQASDGDNYGSDNEDAKAYLTDVIKASQFMAYIEICRQQLELIAHLHMSSLWEVIEEVREESQRIAMQKIYSEEDVISVFRRFFSRNNQ